MPAVYKDVVAYTRNGNSGALPLPLSDGSLLRFGNTAAGTNGIYKSTDNGQTWVLKLTYSASNWNSRLNFIDSLGNIYVGTISTTVAGHMFRSTDLGENWTDVATSEASGWWRICEQPTTGYLFASEYSIGNKDAAELYAYNIWRSTDHGVTWAKFYTAPKQSTPGAKDGIRHIHHVSSDAAGNLYTGFGDPTFALPATEAFRLNNDGTLGTLLDTTANGYISMCQTNSGKLLFGGDQTPTKIYQVDPTGNTSTSIFQVSSVYPGYYDSGIFDLLVGSDGVIYGLTNGVNGSKPSVIFASADDGLNWVLLGYSNDLTGANFLNRNSNVTNGRIYVTRSETSNINYKSIPDFKRWEILGPRISVR